MCVEGTKVTVTAEEGDVTLRLPEFVYIPVSFPHVVTSNIPFLPDVFKKIPGVIACLLAFDSVEAMLEIGYTGQYLKIKCAESAWELMEGEVKT